MNHYVCTLKYYDKKRALIQTIETNEAHWLQDKYNQHLVGTKNEYLIVLKPFKETSFIEVFWSGIIVDEVYRPATEPLFISRHFQRYGNITPIVSYSEDRNECEWIKKRQVSDKPLLDWSKITFDRLMKPVQSQQELLTNPAGFIEKYKCTPTK